MIRELSLFQKVAAPVVVVLALLLVLAVPAVAQLAGSGTITGAVTDPSGAFVPGASVLIRNTNTGFEHTSNSNDAGIYVAPFLEPYQCVLRSVSAVHGAHGYQQPLVGTAPIAGVRTSDVLTVRES